LQTAQAASFGNFFSQLIVIEQPQALLSAFFRCIPEHGFFVLVIKLEVFLGSLGTEKSAKMRNFEGSRC
jgi:hypothetical protein